MWLDRLLMLVEILVLLYMLRLDKANHESIQKFLTERTQWYARRALQAQMKKAPETERVPLTQTENEVVAVLSDEGPEPDPPS